MVIHTDLGAGFVSGADVLEGRPEGVVRPRGAVALARAGVTTLLALAAAALIGSATTAAPRSIQPATPLASTTVGPEMSGRHAVPQSAQRCLDAHHLALVANARRHGRSIKLDQARRWCGKGWTGAAQNGRTRPEGVRRSGSRRTILLVDWRI
jgi:hypothetical protein